MITFRLSFSHSYLSRFLRSCGGAAVDSHERVHKAILCPKPAWDWVASKTSPRRCNRIVIAIMNPPLAPLPLLSSPIRHVTDLHCAGRPEIFLRHCIASVAKIPIRVWSRHSYSRIRNLYKKISQYKRNNC